MRALPLLLLAGCPLTDEKPDTGDTAASAAEPLDLILMTDASDSMQEEAVAFARAADVLTDTLDAGGVAWRIGVTTNSAYYDNGLTAGIDPGEAGTLVGGALFEDVEDVRAALLCEATCWGFDVPSDPDYVCGDPLVEPSEEYLDCLCGVGAWQGHCGSGMEEGLEATLLALCRASDDPPDDCFIDTLDTGDIGSNPALGDGARLELLLISDEGDSSRLLAAGETDPSVYVSLFEDLGDPTISMFGPRWDGSDGSCLGGASDWGVERYQAAVAQTGGTYVELVDPTCMPQDFETLMADMAAELL